MSLCAMRLVGFLALALVGAIQPVAVAAAGAPVVTSAQYSIPNVWLVRDDGRKVLLPQELDDGRPVFLNFIFTSCPGICPLMSATFASLQSKLRAQRDAVHMVSISIDPEQDTPARLVAYAKRFRAGPQWRHYTGTVAASLAVQRAFNVYNGDKMNHSAVTLFRAAPGQPWVRVQGLVTANDLLNEYKSHVDQLTVSR